MFCVDWRAIQVEKTIKNNFYRPVLLVIEISRKFKQILMQNVDFVQFSDNANVSDRPCWNDVAHLCSYVACAQH